jgi:pimeloyl-ACP methyl ester carboxylesterase
MEIKTQKYSNKIRIKPHNIEIYYERFNNQEKEDASVLLLIHGFLGSSFTFRTLIPYLTKEFTIYSIDLPGFGESEKSRTFQYTLSNFGQLVMDFIREMKLEKVHIIGHSMGGQVGLHVAKNEPTLVQKLVLIGCSAYIKKANRWIRSSSYIPFFSYGLRHWVLKKDIRKNLLDVVYDPNLINDEMINGYRKQFLDNQFYHSLLRFIRYREGDLESDELLKIKHPCLLIWGKEDKVVPVGLGHRLHHDLQNSTLKIYKNTGHLLPEEIPDKLYQDIREFLL